MKYCPNVYSPLKNFDWPTWRIWSKMMNIFDVKMIIHSSTWQTYGCHLENEADKPICTLQFFTVSLWLHTALASGKMTLFVNMIHHHCHGILRRKRFCSIFMSFIQPQINFVRGKFTLNKLEKITLKKIDATGVISMQMGLCSLSLYSAISDLIVPLKISCRHLKYRVCTVNIR
jgi:hypothetical protein